MGPEEFDKKVEKKLAGGLPSELDFNNIPSSVTKDKSQYKEWCKKAVTALEKALPNASQGGVKIIIQKELKHWKSELKYCESL